MALSSQEMMSHKIRKQEIIKGRKHDALVVVVVALIFFEERWSVEENKKFTK